MPVKPIPDGYPSVIPYLTVDRAADLIEFLKQAFHARESERMMRPDGKIGHAELRIGDSVIMLADATEQWKAMPGALMLYVEDVDATFRRALGAGAVSVMEPADMFWGDRHGSVRDAFGNLWSIATHVEDVPPAEMKKRADAFFKKMQEKSAQPVA